MNLLIRSAMIFFGTLMAAGLLALGEPGAKPAPVRPGADAHPAQQRPAVESAAWMQAAQPAPRDR
jgi:hypothetical protein